MDLVAGLCGAGVHGAGRPGLEVRKAAALPPKEALTAEQLRLARETFSRTLWQVGLALAAMTFMVMCSVRLMNVLPQELMTAAAIVLQILSTKLVEPAVQRSLHEKYGDTLPNGKEDDQ